MICVCNRTATNEIYTECHPLSLHDALPIYQPLEPVKLSIDLRVQSIVREVIYSAIDKYQAIGAGAVVLDVHTGEVLAMASAPDYRSEEHTSELQSLMRNSYAVFCLQKKQVQTAIHQHNTPQHN